MTEKPRLSPTQIATPSQNSVAPTVHAPARPPPPQLDAPRKLEATEEEPYTIKCICNFSDDDGNTIYCETCDTWQHIYCFYPNSQAEALRDDFAHSCAECKPRPLDIQRAIERTKRLKAPAVHEETADKKTKRPPSKNAKKKPKPGELQLNGTAGHEATKHQPDGPPPTAKKSKHKPSLSVSSQSNKRSPSLGNGKVNGHPPSPATTPPELPMPENFTFHGYTEAFLSLYDNEPEHDPKKAPSNSYSSLAASNSISLWPHNRQKMVEETGEQFDDVVQKMPPSLAERTKSLNVREKKATFNGRVHRWKFLEAPAPFEKDQPLIELYGLVGFQKDYCADPDNLWEELSAPLPFVFFHQLLPLCIDTRTSTSPARYVRQSCKPNAVLETFISDDRELHYWLVSDRAIAKNEQITLPWDFRLPASQKVRMLRLMGLGDEDTNVPGDTEMDETEYQTLSAWMDRLLSEYGGCACNSGTKCAFYRFHQNYLNRTARRLQPPKKKSRKQKNNAISPTGSAPVVTSREVSEHHVDDVDHEGRSASERSKPPSRDRTPGPRAASLDQPEILTELTDREKRKVQMVEDSFRRMEQQPPPRKKKRTSDGTTTSTKSKSKSSSTNTGAAGGNRYVDAGTTFRSKSGSPASAHSANGSTTIKGPASAHSPRSVSSAPRPAYCDASVQTDPVPDQWYSDAGRLPKPRRRVISLSQRLLNNRHRVRCDSEQKKQHVASPVSQASPPIAMDIDTSAEFQPDTAVSPTTVGSKTVDAASPASPAMPEPPIDTSMPDASSASPTQPKPTAAEPAVPSIKTESETEKTKSPELRVQLPPVPAFGNAMMGTPNTTTPQSASGAMLQSPFAPGGLTSPLALANGVAPSPVKKKLSLSDYTKSRANKKTSVGPKTPGAAGEETKPPLDSIADAPSHEKSEEGAMPSQPNGVSSVATN